MRPTADGATWGWVMGAGVLDHAEISGIDDLTLTGDNLALDFSLGYGTQGGNANDLLLDLSGSPIVVGGTSDSRVVPAESTLTLRTSWYPNSRFWKRSSCVFVGSII